METDESPFKGQVLEVGKARRLNIREGQRKRAAERKAQEDEDWKRATGQTEIRAFVNDERR